MSTLALQSSTSPQDALKAARQLVGAWPHARPPDPEGWAASIAAVLAQYPLGLVRECADPRTGLARSREFPPTVACIVEWCDTRLDYHRKWAAYRPAKLTRDDPRQFSEQHERGMLARLQELMRSLLNKEKPA